MQTLRQLYANHKGKVSDKWSSYLDRYDNLFAAYRDKPLRLLEIGVQNGGSLELWAKYFANAEVIVGCDIDERCDALEYADDRICVIVGDSKTAYVSGNFDIIIDDGSHTSTDIIANLEKFWDKLNPGGLYIIEDLHCSYWPGYNNGTITSMEYLKARIDHITDSAGTEVNLMEFSHSLCVLHKRKREENTIGERLIVGSERIV